MSSNYPPGVTGNEPEIAGYPNCHYCGHEAEDHPEDNGCEVEGCDCREYEQYPPEVTYVKGAR